MHNGSLRESLLSRMNDCHSQEANHGSRSTDRLANHGPAIWSAPDVEEHAQAPYIIARLANVIQMMQYHMVSRYPSMSRTPPPPS
jgi:hypothetical protein